MMARRMMRKHHVRCRAGEKVEITSKPYLFAIHLVEVRKNAPKGRTQAGERRKPTNLLMFVFSFLYSTFLV